MGETMIDYLILFAIVFGVNLLPAFGPPTWSILVFYGLNTQMPVWATVPVAASAAASGRYVLAHIFRFIGDKVPEKTRRNVHALRDALERKKSRAWAALGLFALSPVPSAQLFEAAGLARMKLAGFTLAFFAGRLVSYSIYTTGARTLRKSSLGDVLFAQITSPMGITVQVAMIVALVIVTQIDWERHINGRK